MSINHLRREIEQRDETIASIRQLMRRSQSHLEAAHTSVEERLLYREKDLEAAVDKIQELHGEIAKLQSFEENQRNHLNDRVKGLETENSALGVSQKQLQDTLRVTVASLTAAEETTVQLQNDVDSLAQQLSDTSSRNTTLSEELETANQRAHQLQSEINVYEERFAEADKELKTAQAHLSVIQAEAGVDGDYLGVLRNYEDKARQLEDTIDARKHDIEQLGVQVRTVQEERDAAIDHAQVVSEELRRLSSTDHSQLKSVQRRLDDMVPSGRLDDLVGQLGQANETIQQLRHSLDAAEEANRALSTRIPSLKNAASTSATDYEKQIATLRQEITVREQHSDRQIVALRKQIADLNVSLASARQHQDTIRSRASQDAGALKEANTASEQRIQRSQRTIQEQTARIAQLEDELHRQSTYSDERAQRLQTRIEEMRQQNLSVEERRAVDQAGVVSSIQELERTITSLEGQLAEARQERDESLRRLDLLHTELDQRSSSFDSVLAHKEQELNQCKERVRILEGELGAMRHRALSAEEYQRSLEHLKVELQSSSDDLNSQVQTFADRVAHLQASLRAERETSVAASERVAALEAELSQQGQYSQTQLQHVLRERMELDERLTTELNKHKQVSQDRTAELRDRLLEMEAQSGLLEQRLREEIVDADRRFALLQGEFDKQQEYARFQTEKMEADRSAMARTMSEQLQQREDAVKEEYLSRVSALQELMQKKDKEHDAYRSLKTVELNSLRQQVVRITNERNPLLPQAREASQQLAYSAVPSPESIPAVSRHSSHRKPQTASATPVLVAVRQGSHSSAQDHEQPLGPNCQVSSQSEEDHMSSSESDHHHHRRNSNIINGERVPSPNTVLRGMGTERGRPPTVPLQPKPPSRTMSIGPLLGRRPSAIPQSAQSTRSYKGRVSRLSMPSSALSGRSIMTIASVQLVRVDAPREPVLSHFKESAKHEEIAKLLQNVRAIFSESEANGSSERRLGAYVRMNEVEMGPRAVLKLAANSVHRLGTWMTMDNTVAEYINSLDGASTLAAIVLMPDTPATVQHNTVRPFVEPSPASRTSRTVFWMRRNALLALVPLLHLGAKPIEETAALEILPTVVRDFLPRIGPEDPPPTHLPYDHLIAAALSVSAMLGGNPKGYEAGYKQLCSVPIDIVSSLCALTITSVDDDSILVRRAACWALRNMVRAPQGRASIEAPHVRLVLGQLACASAEDDPTFDRECFSHLLQANMVITSVPSMHSVCLEVGAPSILSGSYTTASMLRDTQLSVHAVRGIANLVRAEDDSMLAAIRSILPPNDEGSHWAGDIRTFLSAEEPLDLSTLPHLQLAHARLVCFTIAELCIRRQTDVEECSGWGLERPLAQMISDYGRNGISRPVMRAFSAYFVTHLPVLTRLDAEHTLQRAGSGLKHLHDLVCRVHAPSIKKVVINLRRVVREASEQVAEGNTDPRVVANTAVNTWGDAAALLSVSALRPEIYDDLPTSHTFELASSLSDLLTRTLEQEGAAAESCACFLLRAITPLASITHCRPATAPDLRLLGRTALEMDTRGQLAMRLVGLLSSDEKIRPDIFTLKLARHLLGHLPVIVKACLEPGAGANTLQQAQLHDSLRSAFFCVMAGGAETKLLSDFVSVLPAITGLLLGLPMDQEWGMGLLIDATRVLAKLSQIPDVVEEMDPQSVVSASLRILKTPAVMEPENQEALRQLFHVLKFAGKHLADTAVTQGLIPCLARYLPEEADIEITAEPDPTRNASFLWPLIDSFRQLIEASPPALVSAGVPRRVVTVLSAAVLPLDSSSIAEMRRLISTCLTFVKDSTRDVLTTELVDAGVFAPFSSAAIMQTNLKVPTLSLTVRLGISSTEAVKNLLQHPELLHTVAEQVPNIQAIVLLAHAAAVVTAEPELLQALEAARVVGPVVADIPQLLERSTDREEQMRTVTLLSVLPRQVAEALGEAPTEVVQATLQLAGSSPDLASGLCPYLANEPFHTMYREHPQLLINMFRPLVEQPPKLEMAADQLRLAAEDKPELLVTMASSQVFLMVTSRARKLKSTHPTVSALFATMLKMIKKSKAANSQWKQTLKEIEAQRKKR
eukprot:gnl/Dysnectes_brevis/2195_a2557_488.p1 GENE.gnl/Dysnectes_brevis/2195_a2557_488~~gnl/Dysnectes_brevis/2195_a2557_488.p1  ORF type:complete len:2112 (-),score=972.13 gnl/Dysnectes_brevis/2195_a2557_488:51-6296(-)